MVRRDLGGDLHVAALLPPADGFHSELAGDVLDVDVRAGGVGQTDVAVDDDFLRAGGRALDAKAVADETFVERARAGEFRDLAMAGEEHSELGGILHGAQQHGGIARGVAVVGEHRHAERAHAVDAGKFLAMAVLGDAAGGVNRDAGGAFGDVQHIGDHGGRVDRRAGVRHHHHAGDAAVDRGFRAGCDGFLRLETGLAEMDVRVKHAGREDTVAGVDDARAVGGGQAAADLLDFTVGDQDVAGNEIGRILGGDAGVGDEEFHEFK